MIPLLQRRQGYYCSSCPKGMVKYMKLKRHFPYKIQPLRLVQPQSGQVRQLDVLVKEKRGGGRQDQMQLKNNSVSKR